MDVFSDKSTLGLTPLPGSSPTRERGWVRPIYQPFCALAFLGGTRMQPAGSPQKRWKSRACSTWRKLQTSERSRLLHNPGHNPGPWTSTNPLLGDLSKQNDKAAIFMHNCFYGRDAKALLRNR